MVPPAYATASPNNVPQREHRCIWNFQISPAFKKVSNRWDSNFLMPRSLDIPVIWRTKRLRKISSTLLDVVAAIDHTVLTDGDRATIPSLDAINFSIINRAGCIRFSVPLLLSPTNGMCEFKYTGFYHVDTSEITSKMCSYRFPNWPA